MKTFWFGVFYLLVGVFNVGYVTALFVVEGLSTYTFCGLAIAIGFGVAGFVMLCKGAVIVCEEDKEDE